MRIQHNILAMNAYRNYNTNTSALAKNLEKLSSGYKINRAGDDAAGLAISEKMRAQITGLNAAQKNVKDGISLVKTAEGAMQEIQDMLNRMDYLATQSANGTYDNDVDRKNLQKEVDALKSEINRIADSANFNGIKLLDGKTAMSKSISALGELDKDAMINGTAPSKGGNAVITVTLGGAAPAAPSAQFKDAKVSDVATETFDGTNPADGTPASITFKVAATNTKLGSDDGAGQGSTVTIAPGTTAMSGLAGATAADHTTLLKDVYDISVKKAADGSVVSGWDNTYQIAAGDEITLTAKVKGANANISTDAGGFIAGCDGTITVTPGTNQGAGGGAAEANYEFDLETRKLQGGQVISLGGKNITVSAAKGNSSATELKIGGLDADGIAAAFKDAMEAANTDVTVTAGTADATGKVHITIAANAGTGEAGNKGEIRVAAGTGKSPIGVVTYNKYNAGTGAVTAKNAQVTYQSDELKATNLKANTEIKIGSLNIKIVDDTATPGAGEIKLSDAKTAGKLAQFIENQATFRGGKATFDEGSGKLTFTSATSGDNQLDTLKTATKVQVKAPVASPADPDAGKATATGGLSINPGTTTLAELKAHEVTVDGKAVALEKLFDITAETDDDGKIKANSTITFKAKQKGELSSTVMDAVTYGGSATSEVTPGWDEGKDGAGNNTQYKLTISTDAAKLVGGASFSFGTGENARTFEITYDDGETKNGTVSDPTEADPANKSEVSGDRTLIKLSNAMSDTEKANAIKAAVEAEMGGASGAFNVKVEVPDGGGSVKLEVTAKNATPTTNYGGVRYSSQAGAFSDGSYKAYNAFDGGTEGTYAQVSYAFDPSKLKAGDKLTIGGTTITVGEKDSTERDEDGNVTSITISEAKAQNKDQLISAFESAGFQKGQLKIADGKLTITDGMQAGRTAEELAKELNVSLTSSRTLTEDGLTLQIGDTSEGFNRLTVSIGDMHTKALGIDGIDISKPEGASAAIQTIKDAINQVSSVRGDLGATQNRLEHTANNLSVMAENIQDAESTIRDTDIAEEMMAYTKNNILVQSAQAMLAQANAVPQGVLQLLG